MTASTYSAPPVGTGGEAFASDEVGSKHYPKHKITHGDTDTVNETSLTSPLPVMATPFASGGCSAYHKVIANDQNEAVVKSSAGQVYGGILFNKTGTDMVLKFFNQATVPVTETGAVVFTVGAGPGDTVPFTVPPGVSFSAGIAISAVTGAADNDSTAPAADGGTIALFYK